MLVNKFLNTVILCTGTYITGVRILDYDYTMWFKFIMSFNWSRFYILILWWYNYMILRPQWIVEIPYQTTSRQAPFVEEILFVPGCS
jgi:hypothetical protein